MSDDITFCRSECNNKKCFRHPSNIKEPNIPHSFAYMKDTDDCPYRKEQSQQGDLISREALKENINKFIGYLDEDMIYRIKVVIDNAQTVEPETKLVANVTFNKEQMEELVEKAKADILEEIKRPKGEWVPVGERLPEKTGYYLVTRKGFSIKNHVKRAGYDASTKRWSEGSIIAWQPLPEPYKEGGAE